MTTSMTKSADTPAQGVLPQVNGERASVTPLSLREDDCAALRPAVALVESDLARLEAQRDLEGYSRASEQLAASWHSLVSLMALGTAPEMRSCPHCGYRILVQATRCIQCWKQSERVT